MADTPVIKVKVDKSEWDAFHAQYQDFLKQSAGGIGVGAPALGGGGGGTTIHNTYNIQELNKYHSVINQVNKQSTNISKTWSGIGKVTSTLNKTLLQSVSIIGKLVPALGGILGVGLLGLPALGFGMF